MMDEQEEIKTAAELEAEARERARAEIEGDKPAAGAVPPGQPQVVQHAKRRSRRTLIVAVISLVVLVIIASGGDYLMAKLKGGEPEKAGNAQPKSSSRTTVRERENIGRDLNPLGALADSEAEETAAPDVADKRGSAPPAPPPMAFDKTGALADAGEASASSRTASRQTGKAEPAETNTVSATDSRTTTKETKETKETNATRQDDGLTHITGVKRLNLDPDLYIPSDRHIPCSMMKRFVSDVGGRITCLISEDIYSASNAVRLIPAGTEARGLYRTGTLKHGEGRLFIAITELRTPEPDRLIIPMMNSQATGQLGENGVAGWIDHHWLERIGNTILLGGVQDGFALLADTAPGTDRNTDYTENTRSATSEMAKTLLDNSINIAPTMYLNQGDVIGLITGADIDFSGVYSLQMR